MNPLPTLYRASAYVCFVLSQHRRKRTPNQGGETMPFELETMTGETIYLHSGEYKTAAAEAYSATQGLGGTLRETDPDSDAVLNVWTLWAEESA